MDLRSDCDANSVACTLQMPHASGATDHRLPFFRLVLRVDLRLVAQSTADGRNVLGSPGRGVLRAGDDSRAIPRHTRDGVSMQARVALVLRHASAWRAGLRTAAGSGRLDAARSGLRGRVATNQRRGDRNRTWANHGRVSDRRDPVCRTGGGVRAGRDPSLVASAASKAVARGASEARAVSLLRVRSPRHAGAMSGVRV